MEDKIVQHAVVTVLNAVYEEDFRGFSYGFRPGRSQHKALDALYVALKRKKVNWVLDIDIKGFFDNLDKDLLVEMVEQRIADPRILRLIQKWLNAGIIEDGNWSATETGTPQGAVVSPLLSNVYLHYVLDQWTDQWRQVGNGEVTIVRYADDAIIGFQYEAEARQYLADLRERLSEFGLELNEDKTRLIRFGRYARQNREERGEGKPESFTFLGFQHTCAENSLGRFEVRRITNGDRRRKKLLEIKQELRRRMHEPNRQDGEMVAKRTQWLLPIPRDSRQYPGVEEFPDAGRPALVSCAGTAQPETAHLGEAGEGLEGAGSRCGRGSGNIRRQLLLLTPCSKAYRQRHNCSGRFHQHYRRPRI